MLDKNDLKAIGELIDKKVTNALGDFFENILVPYLDKKFDKNDAEHAEMRAQLDSHENHLDTLIRKSEANEDQHDRIFQKLEEHDQKLEKNERDHEKIFEKLDEIERNTRNYEGRIKKIEKVLSTSN